MRNWFGRTGTRSCKTPPESRIASDVSGAKHNVEAGYARHALSVGPEVLPKRCDVGEGGGDPTLEDDQRAVHGHLGAIDLAGRVSEEAHRPLAVLVVGRRVETLVVNVRQREPDLVEAEHEGSVGSRDREIAVRRVLELADIIGQWV